MRRPSKTARINAAIAVILLAVVIPLALHHTEQQLPPIAAFAPTEQQIKQPLPGENGNLGSGAGSGGGGGGSTPTPATTTPTPIVEQGACGTGCSDTNALTRHCVGNPPRQTEDPQSPPCIATPWVGNNGGATWRGVTATTITVAVPENGQSTLTADDIDLEKFFNQRYEFYQRKLQLVPYELPKDTSTATTQRTDASLVANQLHAFAALEYDPGQQSLNENYFFDDLASMGVISVDSSTTFATQSEYTANAPYEWNYQPTIDQYEQNLGAWICARLNGATAGYTQPPLNQDQRRFGIIYQENPDGTQPDRVDMETALQACNAPYVEQAVSSNASSQDWSNAVAAFQTPQTDPTHPVTTVICLCGRYSEYVDFIQAASGQAYYPEYVDTDLSGQDDYGFIFFMPPCQGNANSNEGCQGEATNGQHIFGIWGNPKYLDPNDMPCNYSEASVDPNAPGNACMRFPMGYFPEYWALQLLASGIQTAGPTLTPQNFESGLMHASFPDPGCDGPPFFQACIAFGPSSHSMTNSYEEVWASTKDTPPDGVGPPGWCYGSGGDLGPRYHVGDWPHSAPAYFTDPCG